MNYNVSKTKNGITLITQQMPGFSSAALRVYIKAGSRNETQEINGLAHLVEHILFEKLNSVFNDKSGMWTENAILRNSNAFTSKEYTKFVFNLHKDDVEEGVRAMVDVLSLDAKDFETHTLTKEKKVVTNEIRDERDETFYPLQQDFAKHYFGTNSLGLRTSGTIKKVEGLTTKDVSKFLNTYYQPQNIIFVLVGGVDKKNIQSTKRALERLTVRKGPVFKNGYDKFNFKQRSLRVCQHDTGQAYLSIRTPLFIKNAKEIIKWTLTTSILSDYLFYNFRRDKAYVYDVSAGSSEYKDFTDIYIDASLSQNKLVPFYRNLNKLLKDFDKNLSHNEFVTARDTILKNVEMDDDYPITTAEYLGEEAMLYGSDDITPIKDFKKYISGTTKEDVCNMVSELLQREKFVHIWGNISTKTQKEMRSAYNSLDK